MFAARCVCGGEPAQASIGAGRVGPGEFMSRNNIRWAPVDGFRCAKETRDSAAPYTKSLIFYVHLPTNIGYFYFILFF